MRWIWALLVMMMTSVVSAQQILVDPQWWDPRFVPADKLHAWCDSVITLRSNIPVAYQTIALSFSYNPDELRLVWRQRDQYAASEKTIASNRFTYSLMNQATAVTGTQELASLSLSSLSGVSVSSLSLNTWSYYIDTKGVKKILSPFRYTLSFASVPECDPDITPPRIQLVYPQDLSQKVRIGESLQIRITDDGKWVDRARVSVEIRGRRYTQTTQGVRISGDVMSIDPYEALPYNTWVLITIRAQDAQQYGGPNTSMEQFIIQTAVKPEVCQLMGCSTSWQSLSTGVWFSIRECQQLARMIARPLTGSELPVIEWWGCRATDFTGSIRFWDSSQIQPLSPVITTTPTGRMSVSLLALIWWTLFALSFILQIWYRYQYHHTKRSHQQKIFK
jgi:hypothetical protein